MQKLRLILFALVALAHGLAIYFFAFNVNAAPMEKEESARVMKLTDLAEYIPPPPEPPPPPPPRQEAPPPDNAVEAIAEEMIETEEEPENQIIVEAGSITTPTPPAQTGNPWDEYLPAHRVSVPAKFPPESELLKNLRYPPIAKRSNIEGQVILDLFIDRNGFIQRIEILRETPPNRGFGEAARDAFKNIRCEPAQANGENVSMRARYPVRFTLK
jgi:protein TonB